MKKVKIDVVLVVMHGKDLEDGTISGFLKILGVPYTSSNVDVSMLLHDKYYTKLIMEKLNIDVVDYNVFTKKDLPCSLDGNVIIKACKLGSSIGIKKANGKDEINSGIYECLKYDDKVIVEKRLQNFMELNQALYIKNDEVVLSDIERVAINDDIFTFNDKYQNNLCKRIVPANIDESICKEINNASKKIGEKLKIGGVIRIDYLYDNENSRLYLNEVNVIPGSFAYYLFETKGIYFKDLLNDLINEAIRKQYFENEKISSFVSNVLNSKKMFKK